MGIHCIYRKPGTTIPHIGHKIYPYLLRHLEIVKPNQVWAMDITYIPMVKVFVYLPCVMDIYSRKILSSVKSNTLDAGFCVEAYEEAVSLYGSPEIINTDQGSQFASDAFVAAVAASGARLSMDGKGAWTDNIFIERFWRSLKYEEVYLRAYDLPPMLVPSASSRFATIHRLTVLFFLCADHRCDTWWCCIL